MAIKNRHELFFVYDIKFANPNGDPTENNDLRMIGDKVIVTDVRLKRTIRDYIDQFYSGEEGLEIFVKEVMDDKGKIKDLKARLKDFTWRKDEKNITEEDVRLFWLAIKLKLTWPVQFNFGQSLHEVSNIKIEGTTVFASSENKEQWTFTEMFITPYAIIGFHGVVNEKAAEKTQMSEEDLKLLKEAIWLWTKNLITRSKFEQIPRILVDIKFKSEVKTHIGELEKYIVLNREEDVNKDKAIMDIQDVIFDFSKLLQKVEDYKDLIEEVEIVLDSNVKVADKQSLENHSLIKLLDEKIFLK